MSYECGFCNKSMDIISHTNSDLFDIYLCEGCIKPGFDTRFRQVCYKDEEYVLATTIRLDEFFIVLNYAFNYTNRRTNYTQVYRKNVIGELNDSLDLQPITWGPDLPAFDLDFIMILPLHNPAEAKRKLEIYTTFS